MKNAAYRQRER